MKISKKKLIIGAAAAAGVLIAAFLLVCVMYPLLIKGDIEKKCPNINTKPTLFDTADVSIPDDYQEVTVFDIQLRLPEEMTAFETGFDQVSYLNGKGWGDSTMILNFTKHLCSFVDTEDWSCFDRVYKSLGVKLPRTEYEFRKSCFGTTLDDLRVGSYRLAENFREFALKKEEVLKKLDHRALYTIDNDRIEGLIIDSSVTDDEVIYAVTVCPKGEHLSECKISITADPETARNIIASIRPVE